MLNQEHMQEFLTSFQLFRGALGAVVKGELSEAGEIALFDSFMRDVHAREISKQRSGVPAKAPARPAAASTSAGSTAAPLCPVHGTAMKLGKNGKYYFCPTKNEDGSWCDQTKGKSKPKPPVSPAESEESPFADEVAE